MSYQLYAHPFSSYSWKALIALHEKELPFEYRMVEHKGVMDALRGFWPIGKFPILVHEGMPIIETTTIIEYLDMRHYERAPLIPANAADALDVRFMDRIFDNHVMGQMQAIVNEAIPHLGPPMPNRAERAGEALDTIYAWLDERLAGRNWASGQSFSLADCAAAPALFYADWVRRIPESLSTLRGYRARLLARPSVSRCVEDARPYRHYFPLGAPDRD